MRAAVLTPSEGRIVRYLEEHPGRIVPFGEIVVGALGYRHAGAKSGVALRAHIANIRRKLGHGVLLTAWQDRADTGYLLVRLVEWRVRDFRVHHEKPDGPRCHECGSLDVVTGDLQRWCLECGHQTDVVRVPASMDIWAARERMAAGWTAPGLAGDPR